MLQYNDKLKKNKFYLEDPKFTTLQESDIQLTDEIIVLHNGIKNLIIGKKTLLKYPVIYSKYYYDTESSTNNNSEISQTISITLCPYSMSSVVYYGRYRMTGEIYDNNIILEDIETNNKIHQISGENLSDTLHKNSVASFNKSVGLKTRNFMKDNGLESINNIITDKILKCSSAKKMSTKQMTLRNAISTFIDCDYLDIKVDKPKAYKSLGLSNNYETTSELAFQLLKPITFKYFPKTLVYGIEYVSRKITNLEDLVPCTQIKHTLVLGKYVSSTHDVGKIKNYDYIKNGYKEYFISIADKLKDKGAIIIPCYYFVWLLFYPNSKIIQLS